MMDKNCDTCVREYKKSYLCKSCARSPQVDDNWRLRPSMRVGRKAKVRIKRGTAIMQDHRFSNWPACVPPQHEYEGEDYRREAKDPDMIFDAQWMGDYWDCFAHGYGVIESADRNAYGNGSIFVTGFDSVEVIEEAE